MQPNLLGRAPDCAARRPSALFDPDAWLPSPASTTSPTSPTTAPSTPVRCGSRSTGPRCATPSARTPSTSCTARSTMRGRRRTWGACCSPVTDRRRGTGAGPFARGATSGSGAQRLPVRQRGDRGHRRHRPRRAAAHPRVPAADPVHAQGGDRRRPRLGGRRRHSLHVTCDLTLASAEPRGSSRPTRTSAASTAAPARPTSRGRSGRSSAARSSSSGRSSPRSRRATGMVNEVVPHADLERVAWSGRGR